MPGKSRRSKAHEAFALAALGFLPLLVACGRTDLDDAVGATGAAGTTGSSTTGAAGRTATNGQAGQPDVSPDCETEIATLSKELHASGQACTIVVRLDFQTRAILAYQIVCAPALAGVSPEQALDTAVAQTSISASAALVDGVGAPVDEFVFFASPSDIGGVAAVSATTGQAVFDGTIVFGGKGEITYPTTWRAAVDLGAGCPSQPGIAARRGWDAAAQTSLSVANIDAADQIVERTAIPAAFGDGGSITSVFVLLYPRTVADFDPVTAEWIVMLNGQ